MATQHLGECWSTLVRQVLAASLLLVLGLAAAPASRGSQTPPQPEAAPAAAPERSSPFEAVRWTDAGVPEVRYDSVWYSLVSIEGVPASDIVEYCTKTYAGRSRKRFEEDLVEVMGNMGHTLPATVDLVLRGVEDEKERTVLGAVMSEENRKRIWQAATERAKNAAGGVKPDAQRTAANLSTQEAIEVIDALSRLLATQHSYTAARAFDPANLLGTARTEALRNPASGVSSARLADLLNRAISPVGDGHASIAASGLPRPEYFLPATLAAVRAEGAARVVAIEPDSRKLIDSEYPYLAAIDDVPIERWIAETAAFLPSGSPQMVERRALGALADLPRLRASLGIVQITPRDRVAKLTLSNSAGNVRMIERPVRTKEADRPAYADTKELDVQGVKPVRIAQMIDDPIQVTALREACLGAGTSGLILDLRGNGGGARTLIHEIGSLILPEDAAPVVYNAARPLIIPGETTAELRERMDSRFLRMADDPRWTEKERAAIKRFAEGFVPEIKLDDARFHSWHYAVLSPAPTPAFSQPAKATRVPGPVVVMMDAGCFSATDIFLCALKELPGVVLVGTPSGGGSGLTNRHSLGHGFTARLSTMVSFRPDGRLLDGNGVDPDVLIHPAVEDFVTHKDGIRQRAIEVLRATPNR